MSLYNNGKKIDTIYQNGYPVNKAYLNGEVVYGRETMPEEYKYIEIEIDSSSGTFIIPFSVYSAKGTESTFNIYVNGDFVTEYTFRSDHSTGTGYELTNLQESTSIIRIEPAGDVKVGWGKAFGFYRADTGCNAAQNKEKLLSIINDPDWVHLDSELYMYSEFRSYQYYYCTNLTTAASESIPDTITSIPNHFKADQYYGCTSLISVPDECIPDSITRIGNYFRSSQFYGCTSLINVPKESMSKNVVSIGNCFRYHQYSRCSNLSSASEEVLFDKVTTIGTNFRADQYGNCNSLSTVPMDELLPHSVIEIGDSFRYQQYSGCSSITKTLNESISNSITSIGNNFRSNQYYGCRNITTASKELNPDNLIEIGNYFRGFQYRSCTNLVNVSEESLPDTINTLGSYFRIEQYRDCALTDAAVEYVPDSVTKIGTNFRQGQYYNCTQLLIGKYIHHYRFQNLFDIGSNYNYMFYSTSSNLTEDTVPKYYTDDTNATTVQVTVLTPSSRKYYFSYRRGIEDYENINDNWK